MPALHSASQSVQEHAPDDLLEPEYCINLLHNSIVDYNKTEFMLALKSLRDIKKNSKQSFDLNKPLDENTSPVLFTAINFQNVEVVAQLLKSELIDVRVEHNNINALFRASLSGNLPILNLIYSHDKEVNDITFNTPLMNTLTDMNRCSLIHDSQLASDPKMLAWYEGEGEISGEINASTEFKGSNLPLLDIHWKGGLGAAKFLLERGANPKIANDDNVDAQFIVNNLSSKYSLSLFSSDSPADSLDFISEKDGVLTFISSLENRNRTKKIRIRVIYNPHEIRELINSYAKKIVEKHVPQQPNFKEWDERFKTVKATAESAAAVATAANATAANTHFHVQTLSVVTQNNAVVLAHTIGRVDKNEADIKTLVEVYSPLTRLAETEKELKIIRSNNVEHVFYESIFKDINTFIQMSFGLNSDMVQRTTNTVLDKIAIGIDLVGGKIPIIGIAAGAISKGVTALADYREGKKWGRVHELIPADHVAFSKELAITLTKHHRAQLNQISNAKYTKQEEPIERAKKLAKMAVEIMKDNMNDTKVDKTKAPQAQGVVASQLKALQDNKKLTAKFEKYAPSSAVVKTDVYSTSKGHSPIKLTVMVPAHGVPSQPLPGPAVAKPTTPPALPPRPVTFSGSATSTPASASSALIAQMSATAAATARRKMTNVS